MPRVDNLNPMFSVIKAKINDKQKGKSERIIEMAISRGLTVSMVDHGYHVLLANGRWIDVKPSLGLWRWRGMAKYRRGYCSLVRLISGDFT